MNFPPGEVTRTRRRSKKKQQYQPSFGMTMRNEPRKIFFSWFAAPTSYPKLCQLEALLLQPPRPRPNKRSALPTSSTRVSNPRRETNREKLLFLGSQREREYEALVASSSTRSAAACQTNDPRFLPAVPEFRIHNPKRTEKNFFFLARRRS